MPNTIQLNRVYNDQSTFTNNVTFNEDVVITGTLTVEGDTTTINSTTLEVDDINITLGKTDNPTDDTANNGGITLIGSTNKTLKWEKVSNAWVSSENINLAPGKKLQVGGADVYAPLASPTFSGTVNAPTVASSNNSTNVATTAYVQGEVATINNSISSEMQSRASAIQTEVSNRQAADAAIIGTMTEHKAITDLVSCRVSDLYMYFNQTFASVSAHNFNNNVPTILSATKLNSGYVPVVLTWSYPLYYHSDYKYFWVLHHVDDESLWRNPVEITNISTTSDGTMTASFIVGEYIRDGDSIKMFVKNEVDVNSSDSNVMLLDVFLDPLVLDGNILYPERTYRTGASSNGSINNTALFQISTDNGATYSAPVGMLYDDDNFGNNWSKWYITPQLDIGTTYKIRAYYTLNGKTSPYTYANFTVESRL
jgi:hypothetical protein